MENELNLNDVPKMETVYPCNSLNGAAITGICIAVGAVVTGVYFGSRFIIRKICSKKEPCVVAESDCNAIVEDYDE